MNQAQARRFCLLRVVEDPPQPPLWTLDDQAALDRDSLRQLGEQAEPDHWLAGRAALGSQRLLQREPALAPLVTAGSSARWWAVGLLLLAAAVGASAPLVGSAGRINLLAPPLLGLLGWNLLVLAGLLGHGLLRWLDRRRPPPVKRRWLQGLAAQLVQRGGRLASALQNNPRLATLQTRFLLDWSACTAPLLARQLGALLHLAAAVLALAALLALYLQGLVFEFRAGWDSTFLGADTVAQLLSLVLGPASVVSGIPLPDAAALEALRFANGPGENAARWIHLHALTLGGLVVLPRGLLALVAAWQAHRLAQDLPLDRDSPYTRRLLQARQPGDWRVLVLPYSHQAAGQIPQAVLQQALQAHWGHTVTTQWLPNVAQGAEDRVGDVWPPAPPAVSPAQALLLLFQLSATPEHETHVAFVQALQQQLASQKASQAQAPELRVLVDEGSYRLRLAAADRERRLAERRAAWVQQLSAAGLTPWFADLGAGR